MTELSTESRPVRMWCSTHVARVARILYGQAAVRVFS